MSTSTATRPPINGVDVATLFATIDAVEAAPAAALFRFRAVNRWVSGAHSRTTIHGFHGTGQELEHRETYVVEADHPQVLVGSDAAPTPVEHVLHGLAACLTAGIGNVASARGIELSEVESHLEGEIDLRGLLGLSDDVRNGFSRIRASFRVVGDATDEQLRDVVERSRARSAVFDIVTNGVPVDLEVRTS